MAQTYLFSARRGIGCRAGRVRKPNCIALPPNPAPLFFRFHS